MVKGELLEEMENARFGNWDLRQFFKKIKIKRPTLILIFEGKRLDFYLRRIKEVRSASPTNKRGEFL